MSAVHFTALRCAFAATAALALACPIAAPAAVSSRAIASTEQMLAAAGFQAVPANTPERQAEMAYLQAGRLTAQPRGQGFTYVFADPRGCNCLYMGDAADYQEYQRLALNEKQSQRYADAAADRGFNSMHWGLWGPYDGWGWQGPIFVHGGFGGHGGHSGGHNGGSGRH